MADMPLVSIVMNCFNGEKYLRSAIDSIYEQTYLNWEIIFWDNASKDSSAKITESYDERLKYYYSDNNIPLGEARVLAVNKAKGELLAFLDCDDLWFPNKLTQQVGLILNNSDIGIVYSRVEVINGSGINIGFIPSKYKNVAQGNIFADLVKRNFIPFVSALIPKYIYYECGGFPIDFKNSTDYALFIKIAHKYDVCFSDKVLCSYRVHEGNLSLRQRVIGSREAISAISLFLPSKAAKEGLQYHYIELLISSIREIDFKFMLWSIVHIRSIRVLFRRIKLLLNKDKIIKKG
jgi:glycosyltransferase involved in cell wall biosynthesis